MIENREEILERLFFFKNEVDYLESRKFFREILRLYKELSELEGFDEWISMKRSSDDCTECEERRRKLLTGLVFAFGESKIFEIIDDITELGLYLREER